MTSSVIVVLLTISKWVDCCMIQAKYFRDLRGLRKLYCNKFEKRPFWAHGMLHFAQYVVLDGLKMGQTCIWFRIKHMTLQVKVAHIQPQVCQQSKSHEIWSFLILVQVFHVWTWVHLFFMFSSLSLFWHNLQFVWTCMSVELKMAQYLFFLLKNAKCSLMC